MRFGVNRKLDQLATIIDETMLTSPAPLDALEQPHTATLKDEVITSLNGIKEVAQALAASGNPDNMMLARQLILHRQALKLLARTHFPPGPK